jgi:serine/threonine protein kinase
MTNVQADVFHLPPEFEVIALVGQGAYGAVCKAKRKMVEEEGGETVSAEVAIKKIPHFNRSEDNATKVLRELQILHHFQPVQQIVACHQVFSRQDGDTKDLYIVMDYIESDLSSVIKRGVIQSEDVIRFIAAQLLLGLAAMHKNKCIHRDLSSRNILVDGKTSQVFICDFGLARFYDPEEKMSFGVVTQWYRAPEIITDAPYDTKVDIWAVGVIVAELFMQAHLFPGKPNDLADQLKKILLALGTPNWEWFSEEDKPFYGASANAKRYVESFIRHQSSRRPIPPAADSGVFLNNLPTKFKIPPSAEAKHLMDKLLQFNPQTRFSAVQALEHPWFTTSNIAPFIASELETIEGLPTPAFATTQMPKGVPNLCAAIEAQIALMNGS